MKYWIDKIKAKQGSSFPFLGGRNCTHKNNTINQECLMEQWRHIVGESLKYNSNNCFGLLHVTINV